MEKKILLIPLIFCIVLTVLGCNKDVPRETENGVEKTNMIKSNIPYSLRQNISLAIKKNLIEKNYGKADLTGASDIKTYEVRNLSDGSKLIVIYDNITNAVTDIWQLKKLFTHNDFKSIEEGKSTSKEILKIDPYTNIISKDDNTAISEHRLANNEVVIIDYIKKDNSLIVKKINYVNPDPSNFINIFNEKDLLSIEILPDATQQN